MQVQFWGVRGSIPSPGPDTSQFGGNTPCVEVRVDGEPLIIFDAGTGIRKLGLDIVRCRSVDEIFLFFSHTHWDHIQGLPFFAPLFLPDYKINFYGPVHYSENLEQILSRQMEYTYFPVRVKELKANISFRDLSENESVNIGQNITVETKRVNHPVVCLAYKVTHSGRSFAYVTDHEPYYNLFAGSEKEEKEDGHLIAQEQTQALIDFLDGVEVVCIDAQYTPNEYETRVGWGHSSVDYAYQLCKEANVGEAILFHHDPDRSDADLQKIMKNLQDRSWNPLTGTIPVRLAREGLIIDI